MKKTLNNKILQKIKTDNIEPKAKWEFIVKEVILWIGVAITLVFASFSAGSLFFTSANSQLVPPHLFFWFSVIKVFIIILFIILAIYQIMKVEQGYKRTKRTYLFIGLIAVGIIGASLFGSRLSGRIEQGIGPGGIVKHTYEYWSEPHNNGLLAGELIEVTRDGFLLFESLNGDSHIIDTQFINEDEQVLFIDTLRVKMVGYENSGIFYPCSVAPWELRRGGPEKHPRYEEVTDGNIHFGDVKSVGKNFQATFERKNEIMRTNSC